MKECEASIGRSQNRLANLEKERAKEQDLLDAATARLARLREMASAGVPTQPPPFVPPASGAEAEIKRLREQVAELEGTSTTQEPRVRQRVSGAAGGGFTPLMPSLIPADFYQFGELSVLAVGGSERSRRLVLTRGTVGELGCTVPASPRALIAAGMAELDNDLSRDMIHDVKLPGCADWAPDGVKN